MSEAKCGKVRGEANQVKQPSVHKRGKSELPKQLSHGNKVKWVKERKNAPQKYI